MCSEGQLKVALALIPEPSNDGKDKTHSIQDGVGPLTRHLSLPEPGRSSPLSHDTAPSPIQFAKYLGPELSHVFTTW